MKINFPHKKLDGILKYLSRKDSLYFNNSNIFKYKSSGSLNNYYDFNAFYFESATRWTSPDSDNVFLSFCFERGFVDLKGYEISTSGGSWRPVNWSFSASNDDNIWFGNKQEEYSMEKCETYYVDWNKGPAKCFKFDFFQNAEGSKRSSDVTQIELFGRYFDNKLRLITCRGKRNICLFVFSLIVIISY